MSQFQSFFPDETILIEQKGWYVKGFLNAKTGTIILTNKRIAFIEQKQVVGGGLIVVAADAALGVSKPKLKVDVLIENIKNWEQPKKVDIKIESNDGESFILRGVKFKDWDEKIKELKNI